MSGHFQRRELLKLAGAVSPDGKRLVFASNRNGKVKGDTNVFIADWVGE
jgi:Tol biopolymer transport system component